MSYKYWSSLLACAAAGLIQAVTVRAGALDCAEPGLIAPGHDAEDLPTNTLVWCSSPYRRAADDGTFQVSVLDPEGVPVEGTQTYVSVSQFSLAVFHPSEELLPHTRYRVVCPTHNAIPFTTGAGPRHETPAVPDLTRVTVQAIENVWGDQIGVWFDAVSADSTIVMVDLDGAAELHAGELRGSVSHAARISSPPGSLFVGTAPCDWSWRGATLGATARLRLAAFDLTGTFSGWTESIEITLPEQLQPPERPSGSETTASPEPPSTPEPDGPGVTSEGGPVRGASGEVLGGAPRQSNGCQLGTAGGSWAGAGLLAALACIAARRQRRNSRR